MKLADFVSGIIVHRLTKTAVKVVFALVLSLGLTVVCVAYIPPVFTSVLDTGLELLPKYKYREISVRTKEELAVEWQISSPENDDEAFLEQIKESLPPARNKDTFFANMFVFHDYPERCQFIVLGKHRTLDLTWQIQGARCHDKKSCEEAYTNQKCKEKGGRR